MGIIRTLANQIRNINISLMETSFQIDYNFVSTKGNQVVWQDFKNISSVLKNLPYEDIYKECLNERAFSLKLIDGALIQFMYTCNRNNIVSHRLAFMPNPDVERFQDNPEDFEEAHFGNELFSDLYEKKSIVFPIRFDYDIDNNKYIEHDHSYSHLTLGNYTNCRIPVSKPITPFKFIRFILRNFYFDRFKTSYDESAFLCDLEFDNLLTVNELNQIHISC